MDKIEIRYHSICIGMAILFFPFITSIKGIANLGWLGKELSFYPLMAGVFIWGLSCLCYGRKVYIPRIRSVVCLWFFVLAVILSGLLNFVELWGITYGDRTGVYIWFMQMVSICVYVAISLYTYNWLRCYDGDVFRFLYKYLILSFFVAGIYSIFELGSLVGQSVFGDVLSFLDSLFRESDSQNILLTYGRVRSVAVEASYFGMYSGILMPWLFSLIFLAKSRYRILVVLGWIYFTLLNIMSISRTAYFIFLVEMIVYLLLFRRELQKKFFWIALYGGSLILLGVGGGVIYGDFVNVDIFAVFGSLLGGNAGSFSSSNDARLGSQFAALQLFLDYPVYGVGFGTAGLYLVNYYPLWAYASPEIHIWIQEYIAQSGLVSTHGLYSRLLAETGLLGFFAWVLYYISLFSGLLRSVGIEKLSFQLIVKKNLFVTLVGTSLFAFNIDAFRLMSYWVLFAFVWCVIARDGHVR
ncbi:O-antigen ligase family protein [Selenomonas dianae]|uniref:O-antigen polymerase n=1 Tax=Selenomonas dianae TaxID=135079 RepID=A0ABP3CG75_9FIRM|nr:hypothetical protein [Selenomonas dianae]WLD82853.1 hypothetical protein QU667_02435 [Selenomonas dianae]